MCTRSKSFFYACCCAYVSLTLCFSARFLSRFLTSQVLKELFYGNRDYPSPSILISSLRTRLLPHLVLARPLVVEHALSPVNTPELFALRCAQCCMCVLLALVVIVTSSAFLTYFLSVCAVHSVKNNYSLSGGGRWPTSIAYARVGGMCFDIASFSLISTASNAS